MKSKAMTMVAGDDWRAEEDLRVLMLAKAIRKDKKRLDKVRTLAQGKLAELANVAGDDD
jgi:hypothetical protein